MIQDYSYLQSIVSMDSTETMEFARLMARKARKSLAMSDDEERRYAIALYESICYFNKRSKEHWDIMRYRAECLANERDRNSL